MKKDWELAFWKDLRRVRAHVKVENHVLEKCSEHVMRAKIVG